MIWIKETRNAEGKGMVSTAKRLFLAFILLTTTLSALAGCGGAGGGVENAEGGKTEESGGRVIETAMGKVEIPDNPERVVVLDTGELDSALALGVKPVGSVTGREGSSFPVYLGDKVKGIKDVGSYEQPNLESIAALNPDLILSSKIRHEAIYDQLSRIAPTVFTETVGATWKENFEVHAEALNKSEEADRMMDDYDARLEDFKVEMGDRLKETEVSVVRFLPDEVRIMMKDSFIGVILDDAGLPRPPAQDKQVFMENGSKERIPDMDGDAIFVTAFGSGGKKVLEEYRTDPLWSRLDAVQEDDVYVVSDDTWTRGIGILGANEVIDDLKKHLLEKK